MQKSLINLALASVLALSSNVALSAGYFFVQPKSGEMGKTAPFQLTFNIAALPVAALSTAYNSGLPFKFSTLVTVSGDPAFSLAGVTYSIAPSDLPAGMALSSTGDLIGTPAQASTGSALPITVSYKGTTLTKSFNWVAVLASDPHIAGVVALYHFDGANGSLIIDEKGRLGAGTARTSTASSVFGGSSGNFTGTLYQTSTASVDFNFGQTDFTVETFVSSNTNAGNNRYLMDIGANGTYIAWRSGEGYCLDISLARAACTGTAGFIPNKFFHIAYARQGQTLRVFVDGKQVYSGFNNQVVGSNSRLTLGGYGGGGYSLDGQLDEFRITKGIARYTTDFVVPNVAFPSVP